MTLALFDLDNTLLNGDSDYLWGQFLVERKMVHGPSYEAENKHFFLDYERGELDIGAYLAFALAFLARHPLEKLLAWRADFLREKILPIITHQSRALVRHHREKGDTLVIITATNRFVTAPIADALGVDHLLATEVEEKNGRYTGRPQGEPCFREGKITHLQNWLANHQASLEGSWFYSDSHNDLPLLAMVAHPVAVDPDPTLRALATQRGWKITSLHA